MKQTDKNVALTMMPWLVSMILGLLIIAALTGCKTTKYVPVKAVRTEYVEADTTAIYNRLLSHFEALREKERRSDSLFDRMKETVVIRENGDTARHDQLRIVYRATNREKELERENIEKDSTIATLIKQLSMVRVDSVPVPYPVEKELTAWQQTKMDYGGYALTLVALAVLLGLPLAVRWLLKKFRR